MAEYKKIDCERYRKMTTGVRCRLKPEEKHEIKTLLLDKNINIQDVIRAYIQQLIYNSETPIYELKEDLQHEQSGL